MFCEKGVPRNFAKLSGKHLCLRLFFNKVAGLKNSLWHNCFPVNFAKILRTPFFTEHIGRCFLINVNHDQKRFFHDTFTFNLLFHFFLYELLFLRHLQYSLNKKDKVKPNLSIAFFYCSVVHDLGISLLFNLLILRIYRNCKISVIKFYKAILHLKTFNFRKHCTIPLKLWVFVFSGPRPGPWLPICIYRSWLPICIYRPWPPIYIYRPWFPICVYQP